MTHGSHRLPPASNRPPLTPLDRSTLPATPRPADGARVTGRGPARTNAASPPALSGPPERAQPSRPDGMRPRVSLDALRRTTPVVARGVPTDRLDATTTDKATVSALLAARDELAAAVSARPLDGAAALSVLQRTGALGRIDTRAVAIRTAFANGTQVLARTLTKGTNGGMPAHEGLAIPDTATPGKTERNTLNNRLGNFQILLTPSTLISREAPVSTISSHPDRPRWSQMPTVLYMTPARQGLDLMGGVDAFRKSFGNALSFASNQGFTPQFKAMVDGGQHSHAQLLEAFGAQDVIAKNLKAPAPFDTLPRSLPDIEQQVSDFHAHQTELAARSEKNVLYPDGSVPHNEVISRLWLWDAAAVDAGPHAKEGLAAAIELQTARKALSKELSVHGTSHPHFRQFLSQQLSIGPNDTALTAEETRARVDAMTPAQKAAVLDHVKARLERTVDLCRYSPQDVNIAGLPPDELSGADVLHALDTVLAARLGSDDLPGAT